jgi:predicted ATPase
MNTPYILEFSLQEFKSYHEKSALPLSNLTVLIGANASGKSNLLEALRILSWLAQGNKLSALQYGKENAPFRGLIKDLCHQGYNIFEVGCLISFEKSDWLKLSLSIDIRTNELHIYNEKLESNKNGLLYELSQASDTFGTDIKVGYNKFSQGRHKHIICTDQMAVFTQLDNPSAFDSKHTKSIKIIPQAVTHVQKVLANILFLDSVPHQMRDYAFIHDKKTLHGSGKNLSSVLYRLWDSKPETQKQILQFIQSLPEQDITGIDFIKTPRDEVMLQLKETFGKQERIHDAALLSDGTLRVLAIAAALLSAPEGSLVVIEEIDNGVHPSRASHLVKTIIETAESRGLRVLLSTHNPALMDALPDKALGDVVFCYRDSASGDSKLIRLSDIEDFPGLVMKGSLGHLVTTGVLDRLVKNPVSLEEKKQKAAEFIQQLRGDN